MRTSIPVLLGTGLAMQFHAPQLFITELILSSKQGMVFLLAAETLRLGPAELQGQAAGSRYPGKKAAIRAATPHLAAAMTECRKLRVWPSILRTLVHAGCCKLEEQHSARRMPLHAAGWLAMRQPRPWQPASGLDLAAAAPAPGAPTSGPALSAGVDGRKETGGHGMWTGCKQRRGV